MTLIKKSPSQTHGLSYELFVVAVVALSCKNVWHIFIEEIITNIIFIIIKKAEKGHKKLALIAGGLPYQGFSVSNKRNRDLNNPLNCLYKEFFKFVKALKPKLFLFENVEGICSIGNGAVFQDIIKTGKSLGYSVTHTSLNSECFGVPQKRKSVFFIGSKGSAIELSATCTKKLRFGFGRRLPKTARKPQQTIAC